MHAGACGGQKRSLDPLELELQMVVSHLMWVLQTEPRSSAEAASAMNNWAISPAPIIFNVFASIPLVWYRYIRNYECGYVDKWSHMCVHVCIITRMLNN